MVRARRRPLYKPGCGNKSLSLGHRVKRQRKTDKSVATILLGCNGTRSKPRHGRGEAVMFGGKAAWCHMQHAAWGTTPGPVYILWDGILVKIRKLLWRGEQLTFDYGPNWEKFHVTSPARLQSAVDVYEPPDLRTVHQHTKVPTEVNKLMSLVFRHCNTGQHFADERLLCGFPACWVNEASIERTLIPAEVSERALQSIRTQTMRCVPSTKKICETLAEVRSRGRSVEASVWQMAVSVADGIMPIADTHRINPPETFKKAVARLADSLGGADLSLGDEWPTSTTVQKSGLRSALAVLAAAAALQLTFSWREVLHLPPKLGREHSSSGVTLNAKWWGDLLRDLEVPILAKDNDLGDKNVRTALRRLKAALIACPRDAAEDILVVPANISVAMQRLGVSVASWRTDVGVFSPSMMLPLAPPADGELGPATHHGPSVNDWCRAATYSELVQAATTMQLARLMDDPEVHNDMFLLAVSTDTAGVFTARCNAVRLGAVVPMMFLLRKVFQLYCHRVYDAEAIATLKEWAACPRLVVAHNHSVLFMAAFEEADSRVFVDAPTSCR